MRKVLLLAVLCVIGRATTLTGTLNGPDGTGITGTLWLQLSQQASLAGTCGGPVLVLPGYRIKIAVNSGSLVSPPAIYGNDCLLPQGTYYQVTAQDTQGNVLFTDNWLIQGSTQNLGSIVSTVISGTTQTFGGVGIVQTTPTSGQTVTQPFGTNLIVNNLKSTSTDTFPDTSFCSTTNCQFNATVALTHGLNTGTSFPSVVWIGDSSAGNFYTRSYSGPDSTNLCAGVLDGWLAVNVATNSLRVCSNGHLYGLALTLIH